MFLVLTIILLIKNILGFIEKLLISFHIEPKGEIILANINSPLKF